MDKTFVLELREDSLYIIYTFIKCKDFSLKEFQKSLYIVFIKTNVKRSSSRL